ncbi:Nucleosomal histone H3-Lys79 methylase, partial [Coelomomyces lativittatus]
RFSLLRPKPTGHSEVHGHGSSTHHRKLLENEYDPVSDLIETIDQLIHHTILCAPKSIVSIFLDEKVGILRKLERARNRKEVKEFVSAVAWFNKEYARCKKEGYVIGYHKKRLKAATESERKQILKKVGAFTPFSLVSHVLYQAYARAVAPKADILQKYKAFSNTVYGEINPNLVEQILTQVTLNPEDVFIDLGSGIGNVVMHVAARTECQAYGIEIQSNVAHLAQAYANEFKSRMRFFNRRMGTLQLLEGDFLTHPSIPKVLAKAKVIFVNNYVFSPELNRSLLDLFLDVNEGTMIVSLKAFAPPDLRISSRNIHSLEVLFDVKVVEFGTGSVSWTDQGGKFYIHTMNRQRVQKFAEQIGGKNFY